MQEDSEEPIYPNKQLIEAAMHLDMRHFGEGSLRLKENMQFGDDGNNFYLQQLLRQQRRIEEIIAHLVHQNQLLADFQREAMHKLGENSKAAVRQQLAIINKETLKELKEIKSINTSMVTMLRNQDRRMEKLQKAFESICVQLSRERRNNNLY